AHQLAVELADLRRLCHVAGEEHEAARLQLGHQAAEVVADGVTLQADVQALPRAPLALGQGGLLADGAAHECAPSGGCSASSTSTPPADFGWMNATRVPWAPGLGASERKR